MKVAYGCVKVVYEARCRRNKELVDLSDDEKAKLFDVVKDYLGVVVGKNRFNVETAIIQWAKNLEIFNKSDPKSQMLKTMAEVGELADDINKGNDCRLELGDVLVTLTLQAYMQGTTLQECMELALEKISKRTGEMVNGVFVKDGG